MRLAFLFVLLALSSFSSWAGDLTDCSGRQNADADTYQRVMENVNTITASSYSPWNRVTPEPSPSPTEGGAVPTADLCKNTALFVSFKKFYCKEQLSVPIGSFTGKRWQLEYGLGVNTDFGELSLDTPSVILNNWETDRNVFVRFRYQY